MRVLRLSKQGASSNAKKHLNKDQDHINWFASICNANAAQNLDDNNSTLTLEADTFFINEVEPYIKVETLD